MEHGDLDLAIMSGPSASHLLTGEKIGEAECRWMASAQWLAEGTQLRPTHLEQHPVITFDQEPSLSKARDSWAERPGLGIPRALRCGNLPSAMALTVAGAGIGYLPRAYVQPLLRSGELVEFCTHGDLPSLSYYVQWRDDDDRRLVATLKDIVVAEADFSGVPLWWGTNR